MRSRRDGSSVLSMNSSRRPLPVLAAAGALFALPAAASAAPAICSGTLAGPQGSSWSLAADGSLANRLAVGPDRAFNGGHAKLKVEGLAYPSIPNNPLACDRTSDVLTYPTRTLGVFEVSRSVSVVGGRLRHLDTIRNPTAQVQFPNVAQAIETTEAQTGYESENGDAIASHHDAWFVLRDNAAFPVLQWGPDAESGGQPAEAPFVRTPDDTPFWSPTNVNGNESARLDYEQLALSPGKTLRLLQVSDVAASGPAAISAGKDQLSSFKGYSKAVASTVVNFGNDPDLDGVSKFDDDCPGVKGDLANGCSKLILAPPAPADPVSAPGDPAPQPQPGVPAPGVPAPGGPAPGGPAPGAPGAPGAVKDTTAPKVTFKRLSVRMRKGTFTKRGIAAKLSCNETCTVRVRLGLVLRGSRKTRTVSSKNVGPSKRTMSVGLKAKKRDVARLKRQRVVVRVVATDAAGNRSTLSRTVLLVR